MRPKIVDASRGVVVAALLAFPAGAEHGSAAHSRMLCDLLARGARAVS